MRTSNFICSYLTACQLLLSTCSMIFAGTLDDSSEDYDSEELTSDFTSLINQRGCRIPNFDLFSPDVMRFFSKEPDLACDVRVTNETMMRLSPLFTEDTRFLYFNVSALTSYGSQQVVCTYTSFERVDGAEDNVTYSTCPKPLRTDQPNEILDEFIEVLCNDTNNQKTIYKDYFTFLPLKEATEKRCADVEKNRTNPVPSLNVLVIGLDTISRLQFHRHFNRSLRFLQDRLDAVEMMGYHKVAENTYPNLVALLSGLSAGQLDLACLRQNSQLVDACPLIWKKYHQEGFRTAFVEDAPDVAIFNWGARGFVHPPTDYYLRPMYLQYERAVGRDNIGCGYRCLGSRSSLSFLLKHAEKTARTFRDKKYFGFHWSCSATHDTFNIPAEVDETVEQFLDTLQRDNLLNNTLLILMADHGPRIPIRTGFVSTRQGVHEKSLPLLMMAFPEWFKEKYSLAMANLRRNARMLTTHFDLHQTFHDLMNLNNVEEKTLQKRFKEERETMRAQGRSLFLPISTDRTCYQARIASEYCTCHQYYLPISTTSTTEASADNCTTRL